MFWAPNLRVEERKSSVSIPDEPRKADEKDELEDRRKLVLAKVFRLWC
jgi:hypothetical protein